MKTFPFVLLRISGSEIDRFANAFANEKLSDLLRSFLVQKSALNKTKIELCDKLFLEIANQKNPDTQKELINLKRDLFNDRIVDFQCNAISKALSMDIVDFLEHKTYVNSGITTLERTYLEEIAKSRAELRILVSNFAFKNALQLSSIALYNQAQEYVLTFGGVGKKELMTERGLLKYLTRMMTKTSPFSSFTNLAFGKIANSENGFIKYHSKNRMIKSSIRINNYALKGAIDSLVKEYGFYSKLTLRLNPTITFDGASFSFLVNANNIESIQRLTSNSTIQYIYQYLLELYGKISFAQLVKQLGGAINASSDQVEKYLYKLISYGFIEFELPLTGTDAKLDDSILDFLEGLMVSNNEKIDSIRFALKTLNINKRKFSQSNDLNLRRTLLEECSNIARSIAPERKELPSDPQKGFEVDSPSLFMAKPENIFYEDTTVENFNFEIDKNSAERLFEKIDKLLHYLSRFEIMASQKATLKEFFKTKYGTGEVTLIKFYEEFYKELKKSNESQRKDVKDEATINRTILPERKTWIDALANKIATMNPEGVVNINFADLLDLDSSKKASGHCTSRDLFFQIVNAPSGIQLVINTPSSGFGRMMSRFLHLFEPNITEELRKSNAELHDDSFIFVENADSSFFNGNIHPSLLEYELKTTNSSNRVSQEMQVSVTDLVVRFDGDELQLFNKALGKRVFMFDLGFQGTGRSNLFQLLNNFTLAQSILFTPIFQAVEAFVKKRHGIEKFDELKRIVCLPRISFESDIIIKRKSWIVNKECLPSRISKETDYEYFVKLNSWTNENDIPTEIFLFVNPNRWVKGADVDKSRKLSRDDYKPQYINFSSPLLVSLFEKIVARTPQTLRIEEMLPGTRDMQIISGSRYVTEFVAQWNAAL